MITARLVPYSSIVGGGVMLLDETSKCIATLAILNVIGNDYKAAQMAIATLITDAINEKAARDAQQ